MACVGQLGFGSLLSRTLACQGTVPILMPLPRISSTKVIQPGGHLCARAEVRAVCIGCRRCERGVWSLRGALRQRFDWFGRSYHAHTRAWREKSRLTNEGISKNTSNFGGSSKPSTWANLLCRGMFGARNSGEVALWAKWKHVGSARAVLELLDGLVLTYRAQGYKFGGCKPEGARCVCPHILSSSHSPFGDESLLQLRKRGSELKCSGPASSWSALKALQSASAGKLGITMQQSPNPHNGRPPSRMIAEFRQSQA